LIQKLNLTTPFLGFDVSFSQVLPYVLRNLYAYIGWHAAVAEEFQSRMPFALAFVLDDFFGEGALLTRIARSGDAALYLLSHWRKDFSGFGEVRV